MVLSFFKDDEFSNIDFRIEVLGIVGIFGRFFLRSNMFYRSCIFFVLSVWFR